MFLYPHDFKKPSLGKLYVIHMNPAPKRRSAFITPFGRYWVRVLTWRNIALKSFGIHSQKVVPFVLK
jgi:hypothetical protein